jgi:adenylate kinase family enzyme
MKRVAVFGNAGGGKSTLAKALAERARLPLFPLDRICWSPGGGVVPQEIWLKQHADILAQDEWVIDGYGNVEATWQRLAAADTLVFIDLPLALHFWWVTKRFFKGLLVPPEGWPEGSPMLSSTLNSYKVLWLYRRRLTPKYRAHVREAASSKKVFHLRSRTDLAGFLDQATSCDRAVDGNGR